MTALDDRGLPHGMHVNTELEITPRDLHAMRSRREAVTVVDVRTHAERAIARLPDCVHIPLDELPNRIDELAEHHNSFVVTLCERGRRSLRAADILRGGGLQRVRSLAGGIQLWAIDIDPSVATKPTC